MSSKPVFANSDTYKKTQVFIDGANLYASCKQLATRNGTNVQIDYNKIRDICRNEFDLISMNYFTAVDDRNEDDPLRPMIDFLQFNGYRLFTKPVKTFQDGLGRNKRKGNMDVEITVQALKLAPSTDHYIFFTGDGDYRVLVEALQDMGKIVTVVSAPEQLAEELKRQADTYVDLNVLIPHIKKDYDTRAERAA